MKRNKKNSSRFEVENTVFETMKKDNCFDFCGVSETESKLWITVGFIENWIWFNM